MTGVVTIDGTNIATTYGVTVGKGSYASIAAWPPLKAVDGNDWQEYDGFDPDLSNPRLDTRNVTINFILHGDTDDVADFYAFLGASPVGSYTFTDIGRTMTLRLVSMPSFEYAVSFHKMSCVFAADTPLEGYTYLAPSSTLPTSTDYKLDGTNLSAYGVRVLNGTMSNVVRKPEVKPLLLRNLSHLSGAIYDTEGNVTFKGRDLVLHCLIRENTIARVWRNYDALLYNLVKLNENASSPTRKGARTLTVPTGEALKCYYKSQSVTDFWIDGTAMWIKFDLTLSVFE